MSQVGVLLDGLPIGLSVGYAAFCCVLLIEGEPNTLFDSAHVGRSPQLQAALADRGTTADAQARPSSSRRPLTPRLWASTSRWRRAR